MKCRLILSIVLLLAVAVTADAQAPGQGRRARNRAGQTSETAARVDETIPPFIMTPEQKAQAVARQATYSYVFGDAVKLDPAMVAQVLAGRPGQRTYVDSNKDGKPEEVWFIDTDPRILAKDKPLLVRVIDHSGKLKEGDEPARVDAMFLADYHADGFVDSIIDYVDIDKDGDLDQMGIYNSRGESVDCWWSRDDGDDNLLWYDIDYRYQQMECQYRTHFNGDESFYALRIRPGEDHWTCRYENPFFFYDRNKDGVTDEVIRIVGDNGLVTSLRWSFDADADATKESPRDYDVAVSARAPGWTLEQHDRSNFTLRYGEDVCKNETILGIKTQLMMDPAKCPEFLNPVTWAAAEMTWDEDDDNVAPTDPALGERWEGILNYAYSENGKIVFPQVGGPPCSRYNKRNEYLAKPAGPLEYYFLPADKRMHLKGANHTFIEVDYNRDRKIDMNYEFIDTDKNGYVDKMSVDVNGDGKADDSWSLDQAGIKPVAWNYEAIHEATSWVKKDEPAKLYDLNVALAAALNKRNPGSGDDAVWSLVENKFKCENTTEALQTKLLSSDESMMYYLRLAADRRIAALKAGASPKFASKLDAARAKGDTEAMTKLVNKESSSFGERMFKKGEPGESYATWIANLRKKPEVAQVGWDNKWLPPNYGWESLQGAFRMYDGHFDTFGKSRDVMCYPILNADKAAGIRGNTSWGMDILHGGQTAGLGGLMLWINGQPYPVYKTGRVTGGAETSGVSPLNFTWTKEPIEFTKDKVTLECTATGVGPEWAPYTVRFRMSSLAGRPDSPIEVTITGGAPEDRLELGIGLGFQSQGRPMASQTLLVDEKAGIMAVRGWQDPSIGWAGFGVVFPASRFINVIDWPPYQKYAVLRYNVGETFTYSIQSDWVRGHRFPVFPSPDEWMEKLRKTAEVAKY